MIVGRELGKLRVNAQPAGNPGVGGGVSWFRHAFDGVGGKLEHLDS